MRLGNPDYLRVGHRINNSRVRDIADETHTDDATRLAVLGRLDIAVECHRLRQKLDRRSSRPLTEDERQHIREKRASHFTRRSHNKRLLAVANGELVSTNRQHQALLNFGRVERLASAPVNGIACVGFLLLAFRIRTPDRFAVTSAPLDQRAQTETITSFVLTSGCWGVMNGDADPQKPRQTSNL